MTYYFIMWFAVRTTHRHSTFPGVRPHQSATQYYIKFSGINGKKEGKSHKAKSYRTSPGKRKGNKVRIKQRAQGTSLRRVSPINKSSTATLPQFIFEDTILWWSSMQQLLGLTPNRFPEDSFALVLFSV